MLECSPAKLLPTAMNTHVKSRRDTPKMFEKKFMISIMTSIKLTIQQQAIRIPQTSKTITLIPSRLVRTKTKSTTMTTSGRANSQGALRRMRRVNKKKTNDSRMTRYFDKRWRKRKLPWTGMVRYR